PNKIHAYFGGPAPLNCSLYAVPSHHSAQVQPQSQAFGSRAIEAILRRRLRPRNHLLRRRSEVTAVASGEAIADREELQVHSRGGCFNKVILWIVVAALTIGATVVVLGIHTSGTRQNSSSSKSIDDPGAAARTKGEIEDLAAHGIHLRPLPTVNLHQPPKVVAHHPAHAGGALQLATA